MSAFSPLLLHVARSVSRDRDEALDAYTFVLGELRANGFRRLRGYRDDGRGKFSTWLVVVARRLCLDHHRRRDGRLRDVQSESARVEQALRRRLSMLAGEHIELSNLSATELDADERLRADDLQQALAAAVDSLPPADRLLLALRFEDDLPAQQIARVLHLPTPFHVYRRLDTLTSMLRKRLEARGVASATP